MNPMNWMVFLILFPLLPALLLLILKSASIQKWTVLSAAVLISLGAVGLAVTGAQGHPLYFAQVSDLVKDRVVDGDILLALVFLYACRSLSLKRYWIPLLVIAQYGAVVRYELCTKKRETKCLKAHLLLYLPLHS